MSANKWHFYTGTILNPKNDTKCEHFVFGMLVVKSNKIHDVLSLKKGLIKYKKHINATNTSNFSNSVIMPGFYDMHFHWVQDDVREMPKDSLLEWLEKHTFPTEIKFSNAKYAMRKAAKFFKRLTSTGTIGGACYSSIHQCALDAAFSKVKGNFVIGNVLMNMNSPAQLTQKEDEAITLTKKLVKKYGRKYCFTPRFAISTTPEVMKQGSQIADKAKCFKQTHLAETPQETDLAISIYRQIPGFEKVSSYTDIYKKTGMLGKRSLMGHAIHLSDKELKCLKKTNTAIIHCPTSNAPLEQRGLHSGLFDFQKADKAKVRWALGSDIGGGPFLSMFDVMRSFVMQNADIGNTGATYVKALYRATLAGAEILGLGKTCGNFKKSKEVDFIVVALKNCKKYRSAEDVLESIITPHVDSRHNYDGLITQVYFRGKAIYSEN